VVEFDSAVKRIKVRGVEVAIYEKKGTIGVGFEGLFKVKFDEFLAVDSSEPRLGNASETKEGLHG
jgi:hypothetical protein